MSLFNKAKWSGAAGQPPGGVSASFLPEEYVRARTEARMNLFGLVLMGVVLVKLMTIDRQHLGNLLGIGSFIGYGLLCTVVGYLAPAPPRRIDNEEASA